MPDHRRLVGVEPAGLDLTADLPEHHYTITELEYLAQRDREQISTLMPDFAALAQRLPRDSLNRTCALGGIAEADIRLRLSSGSTHLQQRSCRPASHPLRALPVQALRADGSSRTVVFARMIGLELDELSVDGCITKASCGGEAAGRSPVDRGKQGLKRSVATESTGNALGIVSAGADRHDFPLLVPILKA